jgi:hypothetical protein
MSNYEPSLSTNKYVVTSPLDFPYVPDSFTLSSYHPQDSNPSWLSNSQSHFDLNDNLFSDWTKDLLMVGENNSPTLFPVSFP